MQSADLRTALANGSLDKCFAVVPDGDVFYLVKTMSTQPLWTVKEGAAFDAKAPIPSVHHR